MIYLKDKWKFKAITQDIHNINYAGHRYTTYRANGEEQILYNEPDTIINTSCEHIKDFNAWYNSIPDGKLVILQSNDFFELEAIKKLTSSPANIFALNSGNLSLGQKADIVIFDPNLEYIIDVSHFHSKSKNSPFDGWKVKGKVRYTLVSGKVVYSDTQN